MRAARLHPGDGHRIETVPRPDVGPVAAVLDFVGIDGTLQRATNVLGADAGLVLAGIGGTLDFS